MITGPMHETPKGPDEWYCPACNADLRMAIGQRGPAKERPPLKGDLSVCHACFAFLEYVQPELCGALRLDQISDAKFESMPEKFQAHLMQVKGQLQAVAEARGSAQPTIYERALNHALQGMQRQVSRLAAVACPCSQCRHGEPASCYYAQVRRSMWD